MDTKVCSKCKVEKSTTDFYKDKTKIDGLQINCKICRREYLSKRIYEPINDENILKRCNTCAKNFPCTLDYFGKSLKSKDGLRGDCRNCQKQYNKKLIHNPIEDFSIEKICVCCKRSYPSISEYFALSKKSKDGLNGRCKICVKMYNKSRKFDPLNDPDLYKVCSKCKQNFPSTVEYFYPHVRRSDGLNNYCITCDNKQGKKHYELNKHKYNSWAGKYRAEKRKALASWANLEVIEKFYEEARFNTRVGIPCHVDHIDPLQSPLVCGLHVENNLRVVEASDNIGKKNKFTPYRIDQNGKKYLIKVSDGWRKRCENFCNRLKSL